MTTLLELLSQLSLNISFPVLFILLIGVLLVFSGIKRCWQRRLISGGLTGITGLCLMSLAAVVMLMAFNIHTYQRLTYEKPVISLEFHELGPQQYGVTVQYADSGRTAEYLLNGDEWQLDARILRWQPPLQLLGVNTFYRLERLNGRYSNIDQERREPRTVYPLAEEQGLDIWSLTRDHRHWLKWLDAYYGNSAYMPMQDGASYVVSINQYGLMARPDNTPAENAVSTWD
jgi:hypothetical protein